MAIQDRNISKAAYAVRECVLLTAPATATGQSDLEVDEVIVGFPFEVVAVEIHATAVTATITCDVKIGTTSVLASAVTPVANTATAGTLSTTLTSRQGSASTSTLRFHYTSNGSGASTALKARVWIRPLGLSGDVLGLR